MQDRLAASIHFDRPDLMQALLKSKSKGYGRGNSNSNDNENENDNDNDYEDEDEGGGEREDAEPIPLNPPPGYLTGTDSLKSFLHFHPTLHLSNFIYCHH